MSKPRSDSTLKTLPKERQAMIAEYLAAHSLVETRDWLKADGLKTSITSLSEFGAWYSLRKQLRQNQSTVETLLAELKRENPTLSAQELDQAGQLFFTALAIEQRDSLSWQRAQNVKLKTRHMDLESRRIVLLEQKAQAYDRAQTALTEAKNSKGGITKETLAKIERELKLL